jgi:hypothetical protein
MHPQNPNPAGDGRPTFLERVRRAVEPKGDLRRPWWQRLVYPVLGLVVLLFGIFASIMPLVPGGMLIPVGFIMMMCVHPRWERWGRSRVASAIAVLQRLMARFFGRPPSGG